jgi:adenylosuccinate synthase
MVENSTMNGCDAFVVIGAQYGDEGKGAQVGNLAAELSSRGKCVIGIRSNGGSNAGHTVYVNGLKLATHQVPIACLYVGDTWGLIGPGAVLNLTSLRKELNDLESKLGWSVVSKLFFSPKLPVTSAVHVHLDSVNVANLGSTAQAIGPTYEDRVGRRGLYTVDLFRSENDLIVMLEKLYAFHGVTRETPVFAEMLKTDLANFGWFCETFSRHLIDPYDFVASKSPATLLIEGANALALDNVDGGTPYVTSSCTTLGGVISGSGLGTHALRHLWNDNFELIYVMKGSYTTRVGTGTLVTQRDDEHGDKLQKLGSEFGVTTGRKRRTGDLDLVQIKHMMSRYLVPGHTVLNLTKLDISSAFDTVDVCVAYESLPEHTKNYPANDDELTHVKPVYQQFPGWKDFDFSTVKSYEDLHPNVKSLIRFIETYLGVPVKYINLGPNEGQYIIKQ